MLWHRFFHGFWERLVTSFVRGFAAEKLKQREKNVVLVASLLRSISNDQVEAE